MDAQSTGRYGQAYTRSTADPERFWLEAASLVTGMFRRRSPSTPHGRPCMPGSPTGG